MGLSTKYIISAVDKTGPAFKSVLKNADSATGRITRLAGAALGLAGVGGFGALITSSLASADKLAKVSDKLGVTTQGLGRLQYAVGQTSDVNEQQFNVALQRMTRRLAEAANGTGEARGAIKALGLDAQQLAQMGPDRAFLAISDAMKRVDDQGERVRLSFKLFDSEGVGLVNTLDEGSAELIRLGDEAEKTGNILTRIDAAKVEAANDSFNRAQTVVKGFGRTLAVQVAPLLEDVATRFFNAASEGGGMAESVNNGLRVATKAVGIFANGIHGISVMWGVVKAAFFTMAEASLSGLSYLDEKITGFLNMLPGVSATASSSLADAVSTMRQKATESVDAMHSKLMEPLPSGQIEEWFSVVQRKSEEAAAAKAASAPGSSADDMAAETTAQLDALTYRIEELNKLKNFQVATDAEREELAHLNRIQMANNAYEQGLISHQRFTEILQKQGDSHGKKMSAIEKKWADKRLAYEKMNAADKTSFVMSELQTLTAGTAQQSKKMFRLNQIAAIGEAVISTYQGAAAALKWGWPMGPIFAAAIVASGMAKVRAIKSQKYGGGASAGGGGSVAVGGSQITNAPSNFNSTTSLNTENQNGNSQDQRPPLQVIIQGYVDSDMFIDEIRTKVRDQDYVIIDPGSRQARELSGAA